MARNIEIKARIRDEARIRNYMSSHGALHETQHQRDVFFACLTGRLKLRCFPDGSGVLIAYDRPDQTGPKMSDYTLAPVAEAAKLEAALVRSLGLRGIVEKTREIAIVDQTRIHLDEVSGLGLFLELEVVLRPEQAEADGEAIAMELMTQLGVEPPDLIDKAYMDMLEESGR